jgi:hypothetical protein
MVWQVVRLVSLATFQWIPIPGSILRIAVQNRGLYEENRMRAIGAALVAMTMTISSAFAADDALAPANQRAPSRHKSKAVA